MVGMFLSDDAPLAGTRIGDIQWPADTALVAILPLGFLGSGKFVVMDIGANDVLNGTSQRDAELKRPVPMQVLTTSTAGSYRLYARRDYIEAVRLYNTELRTFPGIIWANTACFR